MTDPDETIRIKLKQQLDQSGISSLVRRMVHRICDDKDDIDEINLDEVVNEVYRQGGMKDFFENLPILNRGRTGRSEIPGDHDDINRILAQHSLLNVEIENDSEKEDHILEKQLRKSGKYYLKMQILGGKAFLDHLVSVNDHQSNTESHRNRDGHCCSEKEAEAGSSCSKLILHVFYKSQRFSTAPVVSCCDPDIRETFLIEIGRSSASDGNSAAKQLLSINEPLRIIIVREGLNHGTSGAIPVAYCKHDWRTILIKENGFKNVSLELMGIGPEHSVCVGILCARFTLVPLPVERISENAYLDQANVNKASQEDLERSAITMARRWWKEYTEIRADHQFRLVRLFAYDESMVARPVTTFIKPIMFEDLLCTPFQASWFVALLATSKPNSVAANDMSGVTGKGYRKCKALPGIQNGIGGCTLSERWQNLEMTIISKSGTVEDHAVLLASLFLGFGLDSFVAFGTKKGKSSWAWAVTLSENQIPTFWESTTGENYEHLSYLNDTGCCEHLEPDALTKLSRNNVYGFLTISCLFNQKGVYANLQPNLSVDFIDWDLENPSKWKFLSFSNDLCHVSQYPIKLLKCTLNWEFITNKLEYQLKNLLVNVRKEKGKGTNWNEELSSFMGQHLHREELEVSTGGKDFVDYFRTVALKTLPPAHDFRAHTFHSRSLEAQTLFSKALREPLANEIIFPLGDSVRHALKVKTFSYPEDVISIRFMIACTYIPV